MNNLIGWGILGPGGIAGSFARDLVLLPDAKLVAIGSRSLTKATEFAEKHGAVRAYGSYEEMAADPSVDVVYVATPHPFHLPHALLCLDHGKAVLCEKPMAVSAAQVRVMVERARQRKLFLMEAMWSRFNPVMSQVREWLAERRIGDVRLVTADFGFRTNWNPEGRLLSPTLGGGAVLDVGVYTLAFAAMVFGGQPMAIQAAAHIGETGVDEQTAIVLQYEGGKLALLFCAVRTSTPHEARIDGTDGSIHIPSFWRASRATLRVSGQAPVEVTGATGYHHQAAEVHACLRRGESESSIMPLDDSIGIAETMDRVRSAIGVRYPME